MKVWTPATINGAKLVGVFEQGSAEWHEAREQSIGGSEMGTILGLNPWESAYALWAKKTGKIENPPLTNWGSIRQAKKLCESCPVITECAEYAINAMEPYGVWGGLSPRERVAVRGLGRGRPKL